MGKRWGATAEEWAALKKLAKVDLLPVVSDPNAQRNPLSRMRSIGKTPSLFNHKDQVTGFTDWTSHEATVRNLEAWAKDDRLGVCIQTRRVRGFDCDVPDQEKSDEISCRFAELIEDEDGPAMGLRYRSDSGKKLLAFICDEPLEKRSFVVKEWIDEETGKTKRWIVELLADGQQFIAAGTHPDGERYQWAGGSPPTTLPKYSLDRLDRAWRVLVREYALPESERRASRRDPTLMEDLDVVDPVAEHLISSDWPTYNYERGMLYLQCPWIENHSSDNGETETAWMLAGTGGYRNGHFACRHAGCTGRTGPEFLKAVGYRPAKLEEFEDLTALDAQVEAYTAAAPGASPRTKELKSEAKAAQTPQLPLPGFDRDNNGRIETSLGNLRAALTSRRAAECEIATDTFRGELMIAEQAGQWRPFEDADGVELRIRLEALGFKDKIGRELLRDALELVGRESQFDSAIYWLLHLVPAWDGIARIHRFWPDYMRTKDTRYTRALGNYSWTAHAARILDPGCQVDMVPVLVGPEGLRKTSALKALVPDIQFYGEFNLAKDDEKLARVMRGRLVGELAELRGVSVRDAESVLSWITRTEEDWTPKFKEYNTKLKRRLLLYGTTNDPEFLQPHMGIRRWLPVDILAMIDTDRIAADLLQLWAEARDVYLCDGLAYAEVEELARAERDTFMHIDAWFNGTARWLDESIDADDTLTPRNCGTLTTEQVLSECHGVDAAKIKKVDQQRIGVILKQLGMVRIQRKIAGRNTKVWIDVQSDTGVGYHALARLNKGRDHA